MRGCWRLIGRKDGSRGVRSARALLRWLAFALSAALCAAQPVTAGTPSPTKLLILTYHDIVADGQVLTDTDAVSVSRLAQHLGWLATAGYTPMTLAQLDAVRAGRAVLPERAVLLMFDDGYASFAERVLPLLRAYRFPAVLAVVGSWLDSDGVRAADADGTLNPAPIRAPLLTAAQVREVAQSGLVEVASHTYDLHRGVAIDPRGGELPAATAPAYDAARGVYETPETFETRIRSDLRASRTKLAALTAQDVFALVWPYGQSSPAAERIAAEEGFRFTFSLRAGFADLAQGTTALPRKYITRDPSMADFSWYATNPAHQMHRVQFLQFPARALTDHAFMLAREEAVAHALAQSATQVILNTTSLSALAQCADEALQTPGPVAQAQLTHLAWHLIRRASVTAFVALPDPACTTEERWQEVASQLLEQRPLRGVYLAHSEAPDAQPRIHALHWLHARYPHLTVYAPGASEPLAHQVQVLDACGEAPSASGAVLGLVQARGCVADGALVNLAASGWRWLGQAEPVVLEVSHRPPKAHTAQALPVQMQN